MQTLAVVSGGLDSTVMAYMLAHYGDLKGIVSFNYGQRHKKELHHAEQSAVRLNVPWTVINVAGYGEAVQSALTSGDIKVPAGHYTEESMKATVVPNRNMIMLSMAAGIAVSQKLDSIATAVHAGDHAIYPDCRAHFIHALTHAIQIGNEGFIHPSFQILAPFINLTKAEIVKSGVEWNVPFEKTWSCYRGGVYHCGTCATCIERMEAFIVAGVKDPTQYETWEKYNQLKETGKVEVGG